MSIGSPSAIEKTFRKIGAIIVIACKEESFAVASGQEKVFIKTLVRRHVIAIRANWVSELRDRNCDIPVNVKECQ